jgi:hypothetical protein
MRNERFSTPTSESRNPAKEAQLPERVGHVLDSRRIKLGQTVPIDEYPVMICSTFSAAPEVNGGHPA